MNRIGAKIRSCMNNCVVGRSFELLVNRVHKAITAHNIAVIIANNITHNACSKTS